MKKKEAILAISLATALTLTGCASQKDVDALNTQVTQLQSQVTELQSEVDTKQVALDDTTKVNSELEAQVTELQSELQALNEEIADDEAVIESADNTIDEMSINIKKYAYEGTAVYLHPNESEENKILEMGLNEEAYVTSIFNNDSEAWACVGALVTTVEDGSKEYQIVTNIEKSDKRIKNKSVNFFFQKCKTISVTDPETKEIKEIAIEELTDTQDIQVVYVRSSLLSSQKVKEQQKTSTEVKQEKKQQTQTGTGGGSTGGGGNWWDDPNITGGMISGSCPGNHASDSYVPNTGWH